MKRMKLLVEDLDPHPIHKERWRQDNKSVGCHVADVEVANGEIIAQWVSKSKRACSRRGTP